MTAEALVLLTDDELDAMTARAYREAARAWTEYRRACNRRAGTVYGTPEALRALRDALYTDATEAEDYWRHLSQSLAGRRAEAGR